MAVNDDIIQHLTENGLFFEDDDNPYFDNPQNYEIFKTALNDLTNQLCIKLHIRVLFQTKSHDSFIKWLHIFQESGLYNHTYYLRLDIRDNDVALTLLDQEINMLAELVANSTSLKRIEFEKFKLTATQTVTFFEAINKNNNIKSLKFHSGFETWDFYNIISAKIAHSTNLRKLTLYDAEENLTENIGELFNNLKQHNSLIEKLNLYFVPTNQNFESLVQFLESNNKLINLNMVFLNLFNIDIELCDRYWLITSQKNIIHNIDIYNFSARKIHQMNLDNIISLEIRYRNFEDNDVINEATISIIEKIKLKEYLLEKVKIVGFNNNLICQIIELDKIKSLFTALDLNDNIERFYKLLPQLENLNTLSTVHSDIYIFPDEILDYLKYNTSLIDTDIRTQSNNAIDQIINRNKHNKAVNSLTLIDILKQCKK